MEPLRAEGLSDAAIEDAIHVTVLFNIIDRIADSLGFAYPARRVLQIWRKYYSKEDIKIYLKNAVGFSLFDGQTGQRDNLDIYFYPAG